MAYSKQTWVRGEKVASTKLNHMEDGIAAISADGAIDTANIAPAAVTNAKLDQEAVDSDNIRNGAIITPHIYDGAVTTPKLADGSVTTAKIANYAVTDAKLADDAVTTSKLADESVTFDKLAIDTVALLDNKADIDGYYESMTVGNAEQIVSSVGIEDQTPYNLRTSGGSTEIGDREELNAVVGVSVPWNQLAKNDTPPTSRSDVTITGGNGYFTMDGTANAWTSAIGWFGLDPSLIDLTGHVVFESFKLVSGTVSGDVMFKADGNYANLPLGSESIKKSTSAYARSLLQFTDGTVFTNAQLRIQVFDLTLALGSTIADYIYTLEQSTAGAGVAYFRKLFPKPYYAYNSGKLLSVQTSAHKMVGFNQWDEEWEVGGISATTGENTVGTASIRAKNKFRILPNTVYHLKCSAAVAARYYDANDNYLASYAVAITANSNFTTPSEAAYMRFQVFAAYGTTYNHDICINLSCDGERNGEYEPYQQWNYPLDSSLTLRGMLKLDANNNLYADGDRYLPDGTVIRNRGRITFDGSSDERWDVNASSGHYRATIYLTGTIKAWNDGSKIGTLLSNMYPCGLWNSVFSGNPVIGQTGSAIGIGIDSLNITTANAWKTWLASNNLVVEFDLATPTTEAASPYQQTQIVDDFGTEEFVDAAVEANERDVAIPVGNETVYKPNLRAKLEMAPDSPDGDGDYIVRQTNGQNSYIPLAEVKELPDFPSNDGFYKLHCTVTDGTPTLSWVSDS